MEPSETQPRNEERPPRGPLGPAGVFLLVLTFIMVVAPIVLFFVVSFGKTR